MIRILDRYLGRKFLQILGFAIVAFLSIFIIVDLIENLDKFINNNVPWNYAVMYYIYYIPFILVLVLPVSALIASLFSIGNLARQNEIVAMKASGISLYRIFLPVYALAFLVSVVGIGVANSAVPWGSENMQRIEREFDTKKQRKKIKQRLYQIYLQDEQGNAISIRHFDLDTQVANVVSIRNFEGTRLMRRIDARKMVWRDSLWLLQDGFVREFSDQDEIAKPFDSREFVETSLRPGNIENLIRKPEEMSYGQLKQFIEEVRRNGGKVERWVVDMHLKLSLPFASFIIVLFGAPLSSSQTRRSGAAKGFGISLVVTFIYFGILKTAQAMGHNGHLPPLPAAWLANILFGLAGVVVLLRAHK